MASFNQIFLRLAKCRLDHPDPGKYLCFTVDEHRVTNHKAKGAYLLNLKLGQYTEAYAPAHDALLLNHFSLFRHATKQLDLHAPHEGRSHPPINFFGALFKFRPRLPSQMANDMYFVIVDHHLEKHKPKGTTSRRPDGTTCFRLRKLRITARFKPSSRTWHSSTLSACRAILGRK